MFALARRWTQMRLNRIALIFIVGMMVRLSGVAQTPLRIAAAADLEPVLPPILAAFQQSTGIHAEATYQASATLTTKIENGAPFDLFFSANTDYPKKLEAAGLTVPGTYYEYAYGKLVLLVRSSSRLNLGQRVQVLLDPAVSKVAIADPAHAPYGQAAVAALKFSMDMCKEKLIDWKTAIRRVPADQLDQVLAPIFDRKAVKNAKCIAKGLPAGPGAASGKLYLNADRAVEANAKGEKVLLVRTETSPEDLRGMIAAEGILTAKGGVSSHAALVARQMGKVCVCGAAALQIDYATKTVTTDHDSATGAIKP